MIEYGDKDEKTLINELVTRTQEALYWKDEYLNLKIKYEALANRAKRLQFVVDIADYAVTAGDWKVDGACDPGFELRDLATPLQHGDQSEAEQASL